jgi:exopolysaccharide biosynthesis protein
MKHLLLLAFVAVVATSAHAQFVWNERSAEFNLPQGVKVFTGYQNSPAYILHYIEFDSKVQDFILQPYWSSSYKATTTFARDVGAIAAVNGGFFSTSASVSTMIEPGGQVKSQSIQVLNRDGINYPVARAFFGILPDKSMRIDWTYHFSNSINDFYRLNGVLNNVIGTPAATPTRASGTLYNDVLMGLAGGPNLVSNGQIDVTYDQEVFFGGSGLDGGSNRPRTAIGYTADGRVILLIADGGSMIPNSDFVFSSGATLNQMAQFMINLGCVEAMNLDGGGSSTMAIGTTLYNRPNGGTTQRPVPTIFAIVPKDSLKLPPPPPEEIVTDTERESTVFNGTICGALCNNGWFQSANLNDSYGGTGSWLSEKGDGSRFITYNPTLKTTEYEVFGWWSASFNRATDTPYVIVHKNGRDTVRVNQTLKNAQWVSLGKFEFTGTAADQVIVSNKASGGTYVVADGVRFVQTRAVTSVDDRAQIADDIRLHQNYPNPFNPNTVIGFQLSVTGTVELKVFDTMGRLVSTVISNQAMAPGEYSVRFDGTDLASGTYVYRLTVDGVAHTKRMTLIR